MANPAKLILASVLVWSLPGIAFALVMVVLANVWLATAVLVVGLVVARSVYGRVVARFANDVASVPSGLPVADRVEAIEVYWRPHCPFCAGLLRALDQAGVPMNRHNIWEDPADAAIVRSIADGNETVPTVVVGPVALVNPSARLALETVRTHAPHLLDTNHQR